MADLLMKMPVPYEPKRANRFILRFDTTLGINEWFVAGRFKWNPISVKFRDPIGPSATQALMEWVRLHAESVTGRMGYAAGYKKNVDLEMLDPTGVVVEKWILDGCMITKAAWDNVAYSDDKLAGLDVTLQMDRCILVY
jgi:hypothetical protein